MQDGEGGGRVFGPSEGQKATANGKGIGAGRPLSHREGKGIEGEIIRSRWSLSMTVPGKANGEGLRAGYCGRRRRDLVCGPSKRREAEAEGVGQRRAGRLPALPASRKWIASVPLGGPSGLRDEGGGRVCEVRCFAALSMTIAGKAGCPGPSPILRWH